MLIRFCHFKTVMISLIQFLHYFYRLSSAQMQLNFELDVNQDGVGSIEN